jgi:DNA-binding transcriptional LysR family regulator
MPPANESRPASLKRAPRARTAPAIAARVTLQKLEVFDAISRHRSVTRAAEELRIAQPAVTAHLRGLERGLGLRLIQKQGRNIALTEAGERVSQWASDIIARSRELSHDISGLADGSAGKVTVSASMAVGSYVLGDVIPRFYASHPHSRISTRISNPRVAIEAVRSDDCDFAVLILDPQSDTSDLILERLWTERLLLVAAPTSKLVGKDVRADEVTSLPFITPPKGLVARDLEDAALGAFGIVRRNVVLEFGHPEPIKKAVCANIGVSFQLETAILDDVERGILRVVPIRRVQLFQPIFLVYRRRKNFTPLQKALLEFLRAVSPRGLLKSAR